MGSDPGDAKPLKYGDRPMTTATLAFKEGGDAATIRLDDEKDIQVGDVLDLRNRMDESFGRANVREVIPCPVHEALDHIQDHGARYPITSTEYVVSALADYYERAVRASTEAKVIIYRPTALGFGDGPFVRRESPMGDTWKDDVACADCGTYSPLIGPLNFDGEVVEVGDMVCSHCADKRGFALDIAITDGGLTEDAIRERLTGEQMVHRLRGWVDGDTLHGVITINPDTGASRGKTYREGEGGRLDAWKQARGEYERSCGRSWGVTALYTATVRDPKRRRRKRLGAVPLKSATLTDVEILETELDGGDAGGE